jgi:steroid 5-alpha reductase family enzyme
LGGILGIIGSLFYVATGVFIIAGGLPAQPANQNAPVPNTNPAAAGLVVALLGLVFLAISIVQLLGGRAMQTLNPRGKVLALIISAIGLLGFPCGTLISAYLLYLLLSAKGEMVFSDRYKEIIQATPHIKYKTSIILWIFLFLLIAVILMVIIAAVVTRG